MHFTINKEYGGLRCDYDPNECDMKGDCYCVHKEIPTHNNNISYFPEVKIFKNITKPLTDNLFAVVKHPLTGVYLFHKFPMKVHVGFTYDGFGPALLDEYENIILTSGGEIVFDDSETKNNINITKDFQVYCYPNDGMFNSNFYQVGDGITLASATLYEQINDDLYIGGEYTEYTYGEIRHSLNNSFIIPVNNEFKLEIDKN